MTKADTELFTEVDVSMLYKELVKDELWDSSDFNFILNNPQTSR